MNLNSMTLGYLQSVNRGYRYVCLYLTFERISVEKDEAPRLRYAIIQLGAECSTKGQGDF